MIDTAGGSTSALDGEAAIPASPSPRFIEVEERCPGSPHKTDIVTFRPHATLDMGMAVRTVLAEAIGDGPRLQAGFAREFLRWGIAGWTFTDEEGPVRVAEPIEMDVLERWLPFWNGGLEVAEFANNLFGKECLDPFEKRYLTRSPSTPDVPSISPTNGSGPTPLRPSRRSSPPTPPDGTSSEDPAP